MITKKNLSIFVIILCSMIIAKAQNPVDSLNARLEAHIEQHGQDLKAAELLSEMYNQTRQSDPFLSLQYAARALEI